MNQEVGRGFFEAVGRVAPRYSASRGAGISAGKHVNGGISNHPGLLELTAGVGQNLKDPDGIGFLAFEAVPTIHSAEVTQNTETLEHHPAEADWFVRQDCEPTILEPTQRFGNSGVEHALI